MKKNARYLFVVVKCILHRINVNFDEKNDISLNYVSCGLSRKQKKRQSINGPQIAQNSIEKAEKGGKKKRQKFRIGDMEKGKA